MRKLFFPGLGADRRLFQGLELAKDATFPEWISPNAGEPLPEFAKRFAKQLDPGNEDIFIGFSFGGMVALEMARLSPPKAIILISGLRSHRGNSRKFLLQARLLRWIPDVLLTTLVQNQLAAAFKKDPDLNSEHHRLLDLMAKKLDIRFFRWACTAAAQWKSDFVNNPLPVPVLHLHGEKDKIIPLEKNLDTTIIPGAGHLIQYSHAQQVDKLMADFLNKL